MGINTVRVPLSSPLCSSNSSRFQPYKFFFACRSKLHLPSPSTSSSTSLFNFFIHPQSSSSITPRNRMFRKLIAKMSTVKSEKMIHQPILEEGVFRFDCSPEDRNAAFPSLSFADSKLRETSITTNVAVPSFIPNFEKTSELQIVTLVLPEGTHFYGTGEASGPLERTGKRVFTWNSDAWGYGSGTTSLYQSHPWVLALLPSGEALGVLADTTKRCEIDLRRESTIKFSAPSPYPVITFGPFSSPNDVLLSLSHAIGTVFMPPKWALGYQQCRWSYMSDKRVLEVAKTFRDKDIPCDVVWMDIDYMDCFRCFTFDSERFPDPKSLVKDLHSIGIKAIWMLDPGMKFEKGYFVYDSGSETGVWVQSADGKPFVGEVWPGPCVFPDFTQSKVRSWWANMVKDFVSNGVDGIWNDMNEPAVFKVVTKTMPENNVHLGDPELGGRQNHSHYHNVYGMLMARSTYEGMKLANENKRPFVLTRAGFIGSQRYAATWTGDNLSTWEHLHMSISIVLQLSLSGQPLSGPDIGGFAGDATPRLFARWMGIGALFPFSRGHSEMDTIDHEPWSFGAECEEVCRLALKRRYRLLPHIYTLFYLAHTTGSPVASPTFFADPTNSSLRKAEDCFMLGPLLIYTSTKVDQGIHQIKPQLPGGLWLSFDFDDLHPDLPSLFLRGGSIIPLGAPYQHSGEAKPTDDVTLLVALDEEGKAKGVLFEDDGDGYEFTKGGYLLSHYEAELQSSSVVTVKISKTEGLWKRPNRRLHIQLLLGGYSMVDAWGTDGEEIQIKMPSDHEVSNLVSLSAEKFRTRLESAKVIPDAEDAPGKKGTELSKTPVELKGGDWCLKVVPWIGGRIISMEHLPTGTQWLHSRVEINGYEEYSGTDYRSAGCTEEYTVISRDLEQAGEEESLKLEGDIGGGLFIERQISIPKDKLQIKSAIVARNVGAGSGGYSRLVCLRVHPTFKLLNPSETVVSFTSIDGLKHEIKPESGEFALEGEARPNGEWRLIDKCNGVSLVNRFEINEVHKCLIHWGTGDVNLELWSEQRPVSNQSPLTIFHEYEVTTMMI